MVAPVCSTLCGLPSAAGLPGAAGAAGAPGAAGSCCPILCATAFTEGDTTSTVPEFDLAVEDGQLVEVTVTGYVVQTPQNVIVPADIITQAGFVFFRGMARRFDADDLFPGLAVLLEDTTLQSSSLGLGSLPLGLATAFSISGNTLQFQLSSAAGIWRWDLQCERCVRDQIIDLVPVNG